MVSISRFSSFDALACDSHQVVETCGIDGAGSTGDLKILLGDVV